MERRHNETLLRAAIIILLPLCVVIGCADPGERPPFAAQELYFTDADPDVGEIGGEITVRKASDESGFTHYRLYWTPDKTAASGTLLAEIPKTGGDIGFPLPPNSVSGTNYFLLCVTARNGVEAEDGVSIEIDDYAGSGLPANTYEFYKPLEADENGMMRTLPIVFHVFETDPGNSSNNVHQAVLTFDPGCEQIKYTPTTAGLTFTLYFPYGVKHDMASIINFPVHDGDGDDAYVNNYGNDEGYQFVFDKVPGETKWKLEIKYKPLSPSYLRGTTGDPNHTDNDSQFILLAHIVMLADPEPGAMLSTVDVTLGSRTRAQYNEMIDTGGDVPLTKTGVRFDPPPAMLINPPFSGGDVINRDVPAGASAPFWIETFRAFASNDDAAEMTGGKWTYFAPDGSTAERPGDIWIDRRFSLPGTHIMRYEVDEYLFSEDDTIGPYYRYVWVRLEQK